MRKESWTEHQTRHDDFGRGSRSARRSVSDPILSELIDGFKATVYNAEAGCYDLVVMLQHELASCPRFSESCCLAEPPFQERDDCHCGV